MRARAERCRSRDADFGFRSFCCGRICVGGNGSMTDSEGNTVTLRQGETVLIPACTESVTFTPSTEGLNLITSYIR